MDFCFFFFVKKDFFFVCVKKRWDKHWTRAYVARMGVASDHFEHGCLTVNH